MFDGGVWGLVRLLGTVRPDVNTNRANCGRVWPYPSVIRWSRPRPMRDAWLPEPLARQSFACGSTLWHARHMKRRLRRYVGMFFAVSVLGACALPPSQTGAAKASSSIRTATGAPPAYGTAAPPAPASNPKLADGQGIGENVPDVSGFRQVGRASWYGGRFNGRRTASGERFNMNALTAAHKTLPLAAYVRVTNMANQKSVVVRINDRGPYVRGRVIDLSYAAGRELGLQHTGTARVEIVGLTQQEAAAAQQEAPEAQRDVVASANTSK